MKLINFLTVNALLCLSLLIPAATAAQDASVAAPVEKKVKAKKAPVVKPLFTTDQVLSLTLAARMQPILRDRVPPKADEKGTSHPALLTVAPDSASDSTSESAAASLAESLAESGAAVQLPVRLQVRGHFRRSAANCTFPPLYLTLPKQTTKGTPFARQTSLKLVTHCNNESFVVREYLVYRLYNVVSDLSFKARLARVTYADSAKKGSAFTRWGILLEDDSDMAKRNRSRIYKSRYRAEHCDTLATATMALFEYMIGNTDWSVVYQHNMRLVLDSTRTRPMPVPYDFDHSGIVEAPYAKPAEQLGITSVRERLYRGPIYPLSVLNQVIARYNAVKPQVYALYETDQRAERGYVKQTLAYLNDFYALINDPKRVRTVFQEPDGRGVQIKGLSK